VRRGAYRLRVAFYPASARAHHALATAGERAGEPALARRHFAELLRAVSDDPDPQLDAATRDRLAGLARAALRRLPE
jgi:hypothetical protein